MRDGVWSPQLGHGVGMAWLSCTSAPLFSCSGTGGQSVGMGAGAAAATCSRRGLRCPERCADSHDPGKLKTKGKVVCPPQNCFLLVTALLTFHEVNKKNPK